MGDLSKHFSRSEFACHCGCGFGLGTGAVDDGLLLVLERVRARFDAPVTIVSGCRCASHNKRVGGAPLSQHRKGTAADIKVQGVSAKAVADWLCESYPRSLGIGRYATWTHVDVRMGKARWGEN